MTLSSDKEPFSLRDKVFVHCRSADGSTVYILRCMLRARPFMSPNKNRMTLSYPSFTCRCRGTCRSRIKCHGVAGLNVIIFKCCSDKSDSIFLFSSWKPIYNIYKDSVQRHLWEISITLPWPFTGAIQCWLHSLDLSGRLKVMGLSEHLIWAISPSVERFQVEKKHRALRTLKKEPGCHYLRDQCSESGLCCY